MLVCCGFTMKISEDAHLLKQYCLLSSAPGEVSSWYELAVVMKNNYAIQPHLFQACLPCFVMVLA